MPLNLLKTRSVHHTRETQPQSEPKSQRGKRPDAADKAAVAKPRHLTPSLKHKKSKGRSRKRWAGLAKSAAAGISHLSSRKGELELVFLVPQNGPQVVLGSGPLSHYLCVWCKRLESPSKMPTSGTGERSTTALGIQGRRNILFKFSRGSPLRLRKLDSFN